MRKSELALKCVLASLAILLLYLTFAPTDGRVHTHAESRGPAAPPADARATEQEWIVGDVVGAIAGITADATAALPVPIRVVPSAETSGREKIFTVVVPAGEPMQVEVTGHIWSPDTFGAVAQQLVKPEPATGPAAAPPDLAARARLIQLTVTTLLEENDRISDFLEKNLRSPSAHEAAALLIGAFALRESADWVNDVRPSLSRMTAHLAVARALRPGPDGPDGMLARAILTALVGLQRDAMTMVETFERQAATDADRRWVRALKLRITGDWRGQAPTASDSLLERLEHARAVRERLGVEAFLDYLDTLPEDTLTDWQRIAFFYGLSVEAGNVFTPENVDREMEESAAIWGRFHEGEATDAVVVEDLNEPPNTAIRQEGRVQVLDWGTWAAQQQRHLAHAMIAAGYHAGNAPGRRTALLRTYDEDFGSLTLFPIVLRWIAEQPADYERALAMARPLVEASPELVPQHAWTLLLETPGYVERAAPFPLDTSWFTPAVPTGTAFELSVRSLRPANPRAPTRAQSAQWALDMPYDHWALWSNEWLAVDGRPTLAAVGTALNPLFGYDSAALIKMIDYMTMSNSQRLDITSALCDLVESDCDRLGELRLVLNDEKGAAAAYERWAATSRDRVGVANGVTWLVRYQERIGNAARAEELAREAGESGSYRGLQEFAEWLDRTGQYAEAEDVYRTIMNRYDDASVPLGTFLMRQTLRTSNTALEPEANEMLRPLFPGGVERLAMHNLPVRPTEGVAFATFGPRPIALGMQFTDIIVALNGWRVRTADQYIAVSRFSHDDMMTLLIWRDRKYQEVRVRVPERSFGTRFKDHRGDPPVPQSARS